ncbi:hypothetical protein GUJ93_ZPchr0009g1227 [Zizania palustris]|uniref:Uncharacterized protein n=1 Tax=Zizania palustris TaxID=103762 RepID=A0A8J5S213_ZIZPA|nr:hypothetical protein GUJ93_ZPchr0009g1227 [Zizania palustris]
MPRQLAVVKAREPTGASKLTVVRAGEREEARERQLITAAGGREGVMEIGGPTCRCLSHVALSGRWDPDGGERGLKQPSPSSSPPLLPFKSTRPLGRWVESEIAAASSSSGGARVDSTVEVSTRTKVSMSIVSGPRCAQRRQSQDGSADKVVVNLDVTPPVVVSRRGAPISTGARTSPIDVEALDDEVQTVSVWQVPSQRRNRRTRRQPVAVVDLEVDASQQGNKRQRVTPVIHCLSPEREEGSSLQVLAL